MSSIPAKNRVLCAIDTDDVALASQLSQNLKDHVGGFKVGLEFFTSNGPGGLQMVQRQGLPILLDLKFYDIPNTVAGAVRSATRHRIEMLTLHTGGSSEMMRRAVESAKKSAEEFKVPRPLLFGVTVLTSLDDEDLGQLGFKQKASDRVKRLAEMAQLCGLDGVVASPRELALLQDQRSKDFKLITPGIRPEWAADQDDQKRVMTPKEAIQSGADYIVVGRPITKAKDPVDAASRIVAEIQSALA